MWKDFAEAHGFDGITFHGLRYGAATLLPAAGVPGTVAMRAMGHADTRILARYQDVVSELQRDAATRMDQLIGRSVSSGGDWLLPLAQPRGNTVPLSCALGFAFRSSKCVASA